MSRPEFVYTSYIRTTPERLWQALTKPAFTKQYWDGLSYESEWTAGSTYVMKRDMGEGLTVADPEQLVVVADPYRRLTYTWHTFTPEWAAAHGFDEDYRSTVAAEPRSKVTFDIEPFKDGMVKLTVVHDDFEAGSLVLEGVSQGWPIVVSKLKTLLEAA
jgi:uncharacterized protein YndB with AHSA1/START domain